jgi:hypothetical protein
LSSRNTNIIQNILTIREELIDFVGGSGRIVSVSRVPDGANLEVKGFGS